MDARPTTQRGSECRLVPVLEMIRLRVSIRGGTNGLETRARQRFFILGQSPLGSAGRVKKRGQHEQKPEELHDEINFQGSGLRLTQCLEDLLSVLRWLHLTQYRLQFALPVDNERAPLRAHVGLAVHAFLHPHPVSLNHFLLGVA